MEDIQKLEMTLAVSRRHRSLSKIFVSLSKMIESPGLIHGLVERSKDQAENFGVDSLDFQRRYISESATV